MARASVADPASGEHADPAASARLRRLTRPYQTPALRRSLAQMATTFLPFLAVCALMYVTVERSYWLTLALAVVAAGLMVRIFIIQHDCGHGSFFRSRRANDAVGVLCSLFTLTPYANWRQQHAGHHANWNNLDRRNSGVDIYSTCLTTAEYRALSRGRRIAYRAACHPAVSLLLLPPLIFLLLYRVPFDTPRARRAERRSVHMTNAALVAVFATLGLLLGFDELVLVQLPISVIAAVFGVWLFSIQHRFERTTWLRRDRWDPVTVSLRGSSCLRLPAVLRWFTGNIGYHHVHHLNARIPNYRLRACHEASDALQAVPVLTLGAALRSYRFALWDEGRGRMIRFAEADAGA